MTTPNPNYMWGIDPEEIAADDRASKAADARISSIPIAVMNAARAVFYSANMDGANRQIVAIAEAILAEQERCVAIVEKRVGDMHRGHSVSLSIGRILHEIRASHPALDSVRESET